MCILALPVRSVSNTRIFVGENEGRQLTVYEMAVQLQMPGNAMILPVPTTDPDSIELVNMEKVPRFFDALSRMFEPMALGMFKGTRSRGGGFLKVQNVGNYQVSVAGNIEDLNRIDPSVFRLTEATLETLVMNYRDGHSFVVAQLRESGKYHPLAYTHPVAPDGKVFIPTRHEHGERHAKPYWDHHIYFQRDGSYEQLPGRKERTEVRSDKAQYGRINTLLGRIADMVPELAPYLDTKKNDSRMFQSRFAGQLDNIDLRREVA